MTKWESSKDPFTWSPLTKAFVSDSFGGEIQRFNRFVKDKEVLSLACLLRHVIGISVPASDAVNGEMSKFSSFCYRVEWR